MFTLAQAVDLWSSGAYHQIGLLYSFVDVGSSSGAGAFVLDAGIPQGKGAQQQLGTDQVAMWPCGGAVQKNNVQSDVELPSPLPARNLTVNPAGSPIIALVRTGQTLAVGTWTLQQVVNGTPGANLAIAATLNQANDPNKELGGNGSILIADRPLVRGIAYTTTLIGTNNGAAFTKTCAFFVAP